MANSKKSKNNKITAKEANKLFHAVNCVSDAIEDILENRANYSAEFLNGLRLSVAQAKSGYLKRISSLKDL